MAKLVGARVYNNANISINDVTLTDLTFNQERYDTDGIHDIGVNPARLTCQTAGKYLIVGIVRWAASAANDRRATIFLNGVAYIGWSAFEPSPNIETVHNVVSIYDLSVSDYVTLRVWQNTGGALNVEVVGNYSPEFMMHRIG